MNTSPELLTLLADPERLADVPPAAIPGLIGAAAALHARLWGLLQASAVPQPQAATRNSVGEDEMLKAREAARRLGVKPRWLYRHADDLPFTRRLTGGTLRFSSRGLERWKDSRR